MSLPDLSQYPLPRGVPPDLPADELYLLKALKLVLEREPQFILQLIPIFREHCSERVELMRKLDRIAGGYERSER